MRYQTNQSWPLAGKDLEDGPYVDLKRHRLTPEMARLSATSSRQDTAQRKQQHFVKVPVLWVERLAKARHIATYRLALHLLYRSWKAGSHSVALPNGPLIAEGIARGTKWRALRELERLGLVAIERRQRKAPRVSVLV
jgi:hypothetical protein